jgi:hypothetical protein
MITILGGCCSIRFLIIFLLSTFIFFSNDIAFFSYCGIEVIVIIVVIIIFIRIIVIVISMRPLIFAFTLLLTIQDCLLELLTLLVH